MNTTLSIKIKDDDKLFAIKLWLHTNNILNILHCEKDENGFVSNLYITLNEYDAVLLKASFYDNFDRVCDIDQKINNYMLITCK